MPSFDFCGLFVAFIFNSSKSKGLPCGAARKAVRWAARVCLLLLNPCFSHRFGTPCFQRNVTRITSVKRHCQHFYLVQPTFRSLKLAQKAIFFLWSAASLWSCTWILFWAALWPYCSQCCQNPCGTQSDPSAICSQSWPWQIGVPGGCCFALFSFICSLCLMLLQVLKRQYGM